MLIACPECRKEISDRAVTCPHCGNPMRDEPIRRVAADRVDAVRNEPEIKRQSSGPSGFGGWLFLLVLGMVIIGPLLGAGGLYADIAGSEAQYPNLKSNDQWQSFKTATWWAFICIVAISIYGGFGLVRGRDWSVVKRAIAALWAAGPGGAILMGIYVPWATMGTLATAINAEFIGVFLASTIVASIWTAYLLKSKRVRNTYGPPR